tara:strand:+ start:1648 stop:2142 length:495 start_codon:yes stop_codon:yes gene_type:complete
MSNNKKITSEEIDELLYKLQIFESIKVGDKLSCNNDKIIIDSSIIPSISRWFYAEDRKITIELIKNTINEVINITDNIFRNEIAIQKNEKEKEVRKNSTNNFFKYSNEELLKKILFASTSSLKGLQNLGKTYESDLEITSELNIFIEKIKDRIKKIDNSLQIIL